MNIHSCHWHDAEAFQKESLTLFAINRPKEIRAAARKETKMQKRKGYNSILWYFCLMIIFFQWRTIADNGIRKAFHSFVPSESSPILTKWNIKLTDTTRFYIQESIDKYNRVIEIKFMEKSRIFSGFTAFEVPIIRYSYKKNAIIEKNFDQNDKPFYGLESGTPTSATYFLEKAGKILKCSHEVYIPPDIYKTMDTSNLSSAIADIKNTKCRIIEHYWYSSTKYSGRFPCQMNQILLA
jgi:hypothetical protein